MDGWDEKCDNRNPRGDWVCPYLFFITSNYTLLQKKCTLISSSSPGDPASQAPTPGHVKFVKWSCGRWPWDFRKLGWFSCAPWTCSCTKNIFTWKAKYVMDNSYSWLSSSQTLCSFAQHYKKCVLLRWYAPICIL